MNLNYLTDEQLLKDTKTYVQRERSCICVILYHLIEIEARKLFSDLKYQSMRDYAVKELKYSDSAAGRRINAARLLHELPRIGDLIFSGQLNLSILQKSHIHFRREKISDSKIKDEVISLLVGKTLLECDRILLELTPRPLPSESIRPVSKDHFQIKINVTESTHQKLDDVKSLLGFHLIDDACFEAIADEAKENILRKRFKLTPNGRKTQSTGLRPSNYERRTSYENSEEKVCENCGSLFLLQDDHRESKALGGSNDPSNLRLLCFNCNQRARIKAKL